MRRGRLVAVDWVDTAGTAEWRPPADARVFELVHCVSVGYLIAHHDDRLILAASINDQGDYADLTAIPRGCIVALRRLRV